MANLIRESKKADKVKYGEFKEDRPFKHAMAKPETNPYSVEKVFKPNRYQKQMEGLYGEINEVKKIDFAA